jgi:hypothetical protein
MLDDVRALGTAQLALGGELERAQALLERMRASMPQYAQTATIKVDALEAFQQALRRMSDEHAAVMADALKALVEYRERHPIYEDRTVGVEQLVRSITLLIGDALYKPTQEAARPVLLDAAAILLALVELLDDNVAIGYPNGARRS